MRLSPQAFSIIKAIPFWPAMSIHQNLIKTHGPVTTGTAQSSKATLAKHQNSIKIHMAAFPNAAKRFFPGPPLFPLFGVGAGDGDGAGDGVGAGDGAGEGVPPEPLAGGRGGVGVGFPFFCSHWRRFIGFGSKVPGTTFFSFNHAKMLRSTNR